MRQIGLCQFKLGFGLLNRTDGQIALIFGGGKGGDNLSELGLCRDNRGLFPVAIQPEDRITRLYILIVLDKDFFDPPAFFRQDGDRAKKRGHVARAGVVIKHDREKRDRQHRAGGDPVAQLVPDREEIDLVADPLALKITTDQIIGQDRDQRAKRQFNHGPPTPCLWPCLLRAAQAVATRRPPSWTKTARWTSAAL